MTAADTVTRVVLIDDEPLIRSGLRAIIDAEKDLEVVGEVDDGAFALSAVHRLRPDVVLMDVRMPKLDGISATRQILDAVETPPRILVVTTFSNDDYVYEALTVGAQGFLLKRAHPADILQAIRVVAGGESIVFPAAIRDLAARQPTRSQEDRLANAGLSEREAEVLRQMAAGLSNAEIAAELFVSLETVKSHVRSVLAKVGARDRTQAVIAAYESGFIPVR